MMFPGLLLTATWLSGIAVSSPADGDGDGDGTLVTPLESGSVANTSKITIAVGKGSFSFIPNTVAANPGDEIIFEFWSRGHSVARSAFGFPCMPYEYIITEEPGFWSGFIDDVTPTSRPTFSVTINDTEPVFFYCAAFNSCKENRMIGVINPNSTWTFAEQDSFINPRVIELRPGDPLPSESNRTAPNPVDANDANDDDTPTLTDGEIAGVAMSSVALVILVAALAFTCVRQRRLEKQRRKQAKKPFPLDLNSNTNISTDNNTNSDPNTLPLINAMSPRTCDDDITATLRSPPPLLHVGGPRLSFASPVSPGPQQVFTNPGHWSVTTGMTATATATGAGTTSRRESFRLCLPGVVSNVSSETSLGYHSEQHRSEVPGSLAAVELPAADECRVEKSS